MQTISQKTTRFNDDSPNLANPYAFFQLPIIDEFALKAVQAEACEHLFMASEDEREGASKVIVKSQQLKLINEIDINREFSKLTKGQAVEYEMLSTLKSNCEQALVDKCMDSKYSLDLDITPDLCSLSCFDIQEVYIDTTDFKLTDRWLAYSSLEIISRYMLPLMPPFWYLTASYSIISEIIDSGEFDLLADYAMKYDTSESLAEFLVDNVDCEYLGHFLEEFNYDLATCVSALLDYESVTNDSNKFNAYQKENNLYFSSGDSTTAVIKRHIKLLSVSDNSILICLYRLLSRLLKSNTYIAFETDQDEDTQPLDFSLTILDKPYSNLISYLQESKVDELNQVGEPLKENIPFDGGVVERLNLLTYAFRELNKLSNERKS